jgi:hypothetical protein
MLFRVTPENLNFRTAALAFPNQENDSAILVLAPMI